MKKTISRNGNNFELTMQEDGKNLMLNLKALPSQVEMANDLRLSAPTIRMIIEKIEKGEHLGKYERLLFNYQLNRKILDDLDKIKSLKNIGNEEIAKEIGISHGNYRMKLTALRRGKSPVQFISLAQEYIAKHRE